MMRMRCGFVVTLCCMVVNALAQDVALTFHDSIPEDDALVERFSEILLPALTSPPEDLDRDALREAIGELRMIPEFVHTLVRIERHPELVNMNQRSGLNEIILINVQNLKHSILNDEMQNRVAELLLPYALVDDPYTRHIVRADLSRHMHWEELSKFVSWEIDKNDPELLSFLFVRHPYSITLTGVAPIIGSEATTELQITLSEIGTSATELEFDSPKSGTRDETLVKIDTIRKLKSVWIDAFVASVLRRSRMLREPSLVDELLESKNEVVRLMIESVPPDERYYSEDVP